MSIFALCPRVYSTEKIQFSFFLYKQFLLFFFLLSRRLLLLSTFFPFHYGFVFNIFCTFTSQITHKTHTPTYKRCVKAHSVKTFDGSHCAICLVCYCTFVPTC